MSCSPEPMCVCLCACVLLSPDPPAQLRIYAPGEVVHMHTRLHLLHMTHMRRVWERFECPWYPPSPPPYIGLHACVVKLVRRCGNAECYLIWRGLWFICWFWFLYMRVDTVGASHVWTGPDSDAFWVCVSVYVCVCVSSVGCTRLWFIAFGYAWRRNGPHLVCRNRLGRPECVCVGNAMEIRFTVDLILQYILFVVCYNGRFYGQRFS